MQAPEGMDRSARGSLKWDNFLKGNSVIVLRCPDSLTWYMRSGAKSLVFAAVFLLPNTSRCPDLSTE